jgi:hypothetical protein
MWANEHGLDINTLPNVSSPIIESPRFLVDLNQTGTMIPQSEDQTNIHHVHILLEHVDHETTTLNNPIIDVDREKLLFASINRRENNMLRNLPKNVEHLEAIDNLFRTLEEEIN